MIEVMIEVVTVVVINTKNATINYKTIVVVVVATSSSNATTTTSIVNHFTTIQHLFRLIC